SYDYKDIVRAEQVAAADDVAYCAWVDTDDLPLADDNVHYVEPGVSELGERWAEAWLDIAAPSAVLKTGAPSGWALEQNYPNPFNPSTIVEFRLAKPGRVSLVAYDVLGRKVATLWNGAARCGRTRVSFDGGKLAAGTYLVRLVTEGGSETIKATLVK
ncbi:MAG: T9SS type A sorting domain-containing protein, partial [Ignavibacteriales bacterium]|nr:T9SS type A sorting domain-containing protein [Ignavibacteriales bacterium]